MTRRKYALWFKLTRILMCRMLVGIGLMLVQAGCQLTTARTDVASPSHPRLQALSRDYVESVPPAEVPNLPIPEIFANLDANEPWPLSLREAVYIALRNSQIIRTLEGDQVTSTLVTNYDPAIQQAAHQAALAAFDANLNLSYNVNKFHQPPAAFFGPGIPANTRRDDRTLNASLVKPWATGGTTSIGYNPTTGFLYLPDGTTGQFNPRFSSNVELFARQPMLRGAGIDVNRAPIRIAQLQADQSIWDVKQATLALVRSVEEAYWSLQAARTALQVVEDILPFIDDVVRIQEIRLEEERTIRAEVAKARTQQASFRQSQIEARSNVINQELHLRNLIGLSPNDGLTIIAKDQPSRAPLQIDPVETVRTAANNRPDVMRQRLGIRIREMGLVVAENGLKPQLDLQALYRTNGLSDNLGDALAMTAKNEYTDWSAGATFSVPLGRRAARANLHGAELELRREQMVLRQQLHAMAHRLSDLLRQIESIRNQYDQAQIRVEETDEWLQGAQSRYEDPPPSGDGQDWLLLALNDYLLAMHSKADSTSEMAQLLARYNTLLASLQEAQGTLLANYDIRLDGDPIVQARNSVWLPGSEALIEPEIWNLDAPATQPAAPATPSATRRVPGFTPRTLQ